MIMRINYYDIGYTNGFEDARKGRTKNFLRKMPKAKSLLPVIGKQISSSYVQGYDRGYLDGCRKKKGFF